MSVESSGLHNLTRTKCWKKIFLSSGSRVRFCNRPYSRFLMTESHAWEYVLKQLRQKDQLLSVLPQFVQNKDVYFIISQGYVSEVLLLCHAQHTSKEAKIVSLLSYHFYFLDIWKWCNRDINLDFNRTSLRDKKNPNLLVIKNQFIFYLCIFIQITCIVWPDARVITAKQRSQTCG